MLLLFYHVNIVDMALSSALLPEQITIYYFGIVQTVSSSWTHQHLSTQIILGWLRRTSDLGTLFTESMIFDIGGQLN